jgi:phospholipid/cholesterol/gamma-HCH transport system substrate-binding protein
MDTDFSRMERVVGAFLIVIVAILLTILLVVGRGKNWFEAYVSYYTVFDESYGIKKDTAVKLYNTDVGKVTRLALTEDKVKVELIIQKTYAPRVKTDSFAIVEKPAIFMGTEFVSIKPGSLPNAVPIPEGGRIPSMPKKSISDLMVEFGLDEVFQKAVIAAEGLVVAAKDLVEVAKRLRDPQGPLFATLDNAYKTVSHIEGITRDMQAGRGSVGKLLKSGKMLDSVQTQIEKLDIILANLADASTRAPKTMDQVQDSLDGVRSILEEVLASASTIKTILGEAEKGSREIPKISRTARQGLEDARMAIENADKIMQSLQKSILIRSNLPPEPEGQAVDAGLR